MPVVIIGLGVVGLLAFMLAYGAIVGAFVLNALWGWFITPAFGLAVPPFPILAGLSLVTHFLTSHTQTTYKDHEANNGYDICLGMLGPWMALFAGWLIHLWAGI